MFRIVPRITGSVSVLPYRKTAVYSLELTEFVESTDFLDFPDEPPFGVGGVDGVDEANKFPFGPS